jgi:hypothetical protein
VRILAIDLASVRSGVCLRDETGVLEHYTTNHDEPNGEVTKMVKLMSGAYVVIESVPPNMPNNTTLKNVYRKQGRLLVKLEQTILTRLDNPEMRWEIPSEVVWVKPDSWQRHFEVFKQGKMAARERAASLGWIPPEKRTDQKTLEDLADSYLLAAYGLWSLSQHATLRTKWAFEVTYPPGG